MGGLKKAMSVNEAGPEVIPSRRSNPARAFLSGLEKRAGVPNENITRSFGGPEHSAKSDIGGRLAGFAGRAVGTAARPENLAMGKIGGMALGKGIKIAKRVVKASGIHVPDVVTGATKRLPDWINAIRDKASKLGPGTRIGSASGKGVSMMSNAERGAEDAVKDFAQKHGTEYYMRGVDLLHGAQRELGGRAGRYERAMEILGREFQAPAMKPPPSAYEKFVSPAMQKAVGQPKMTLKTAMLAKQKNDFVPVPYDARRERRR